MSTIMQIHLLRSIHNHQANSSTPITNITCLRSSNGSALLADFESVVPLPPSLQYLQMHVDHNPKTYKVERANGLVQLVETDMSSFTDWTSDRLLDHIVSVPAGET